MAERGAELSISNTLCRTQRQAEAICDIVTSVILGQRVAEVPRLLVGRETLDYITRVCK